MSTIEELVFAVAQSPWALVALTLLLVIDGFFPLVPGETMVVTLAALGASGHGPDPLVVLWVATAATMVGDGIAFAIGRRMHPARWPWMRGPRTQAAFLWASGHVSRSPGVVLIGAKFLPFVRVAVTMTAGAGSLRIPTYLACSFIASLVYTGYHVIVAVTAGTIFIDNPLLGLATSIGFGAVTAAAIAGVRRLRERGGARSVR
jgi:membrane protein DedA with SNARE-associated domain